MKRVISLIAVLALVCFTTMVFAADAAAPAAKADVAKAEVVKGKITKIDTAANTIVVKGKTITVKAEDIATLKKGEMVKVTLAAGTMNADKVEVVKAKKMKKAEEKPAEKKAE
jgi:hypothetical protein